MGEWWGTWWGLLFQFSLSLILGPIPSYRPRSPLAPPPTPPLPSGRRNSKSLRNECASVTAGLPLRTKMANGSFLKWRSRFLK